MCPVSPRSVVTAAKDQISGDLGGEVVVLGLKPSAYFGMDGVAARVWSLLHAPRRVTEIAAAILQEYDVDPESCERDLLAFLNELAAEGLIDVGHDAAS